MTNTKANVQGGVEHRAEATVPAKTGCCGGPAPVESGACCVKDHQHKSAGGSGCGCGAPRPEVKACC